MSDQQRMDPWHVITWLTELRVKRLFVENVPEFVEWGPVGVHTGRPVKERKGDYFQRWLSTIRALGYNVEWQTIQCANLGDATTRRRFFLIARNDDKAIRWPAWSHSKEGGPDLYR